MGDSAKPSPSYRRVLDTRKRVLKETDADIFNSTNDLASLFAETGRFSSAEPLFRQLLDACERLFPEQPACIQGITNNLASLYRLEGRYSEAEPLNKRVLEIRERTLARNDPKTILSVTALARTYLLQGRYDEAEPLFRRAVQYYTKTLGNEHADTLRESNELGVLYRIKGEFSLAEPILKHVYEARQRIFGEAADETLDSAVSLADLYTAQERSPEALALYTKALDGYERLFGKDHDDTLVAVDKLAAFYYRQRDFISASQYWKRGVASITGRRLRNAADNAQGLTGIDKGQQGEVNGQFWRLIKATSRLPVRGPTKATEEMFEAAQWSLQSETAFSLTEMAARAAAANPELEKLVRERQDLVGEWQKLLDQRYARLAKALDPVNAQADVTQSRLNVIEPRVKEIDAIFKSEFSAYVGLASPAPLSIADVQALLDFERGARSDHRHARPSENAGGDLHLGRDEDGCASCTERARYTGTYKGDYGFALRPRCGGLG